MNLTPWFPKTVKPTRKGIYELQEADWGSPCFAYWNGSKFGFRSSSTSRAYANRDSATCFPALARWRGMAEKPG